MELFAGGGFLLLIILLGAVSFAVSRYRRCPSNKVIVVYGKTEAAGSSKCVHGGGVFVWPLIQDFGVLSLHNSWSMYNSPLVMSSNPATILNVVDLPHPDGPTKTINSCS